MSLRQLVLNINLEKLQEIESYLNWADNYGLSDDDHDGWVHCKDLERQAVELRKQIDLGRKYS